MGDKVTTMAQLHRIRREIHLKMIDSIALMMMTLVLFGFSLGCVNTT